MSSMIVILSDERSEESKDPYGSNEPTFFAQLSLAKNKTGRRFLPGH